MLWLPLGLFWTTKSFTPYWIFIFSCCILLNNFYAVNMPSSVWLKSCFSDQFDLFSITIFLLFLFLIHRLNMKESKDRHSKFLFSILIKLCYTELECLSLYFELTIQSSNIYIGIPPNWNVSLILDYKRHSIVYLCFTFYWITRKV